MSFKRQVISGLLWSIFSKLVTQILSWVSTFFVIRLLTPEDYGVMSIAAVFFTLVSMFATSGLSKAVVNEQKRCERTSNLIFTFSLLVNLVLSSLVVISAPFIADWYNNQNLVPVLWMMAAISPASSFIVIPLAHLQMEMRFKSKAFIEGAAMLFGSIVALSLALNLDTGYWALVFSSVAITVVRMIGYNLVARSRYRPTLNFKGAFSLYSFALHLQLGGVIWFLYSRADTLILGKFLGLEKTGVYNVANEVATIPMNKVTMIMNDVAFAAFNKVKTDMVAAKAYLQKALRLLSVVAFPVFYGIASISNEIVSIVLGEKWIEAGPLISLFCIIVPFRMLNILLGNFITGMGEVKFGLKNAILTAICLITALFIGGPYGLKIAAFTWSLGYAIALIIMYRRFLCKFDLPWRFFSVACTPFFLSALMLVGLSQLGGYLASQTTFSIEVWQIMFLKILAGGGSLGLALLCLYGREMRELLSKA
ncbi:lipopolysaccharide biosynthesis protein [Alteromonas sp. 14N.309.X.WAT.G.H12]|uniref:lipopolysaccharide biosynthesis protein n=1 Tax=Alteromonas sp. 14N.309.X.WAT.G.H12 TaxID=3120824 RepID=UPI002FD08F72